MSGFLKERVLPNLFCKKWTAQDEKTKEKIEVLYPVIDNLNKRWY